MIVVAIQSFWLSHADRKHPCGTFSWQAVNGSQITTFGILVFDPVLSTLGYVVPLDGLCHC